MPRGRCACATSPRAPAGRRGWSEDRARIEAAIARFPKEFGLPERRGDRTSVRRFAKGTEAELRAAMLPLPRSGNGADGARATRYFYHDADGKPLSKRDLANLKRLAKFVSPSGALGWEALAARPKVSMAPLAVFRTGGSFKEAAEALRTRER